MTLATAPALQAWRSQWKAILLGVALTLGVFGAAWQLAVLVDQRSSYVVPEPDEAQAILAAAMDFEITAVRAEVDLRASWDRRRSGLPTRFPSRIPANSMAASPCQIFYCNAITLEMITQMGFVRSSADFWYSSATYLGQYDLQSYVGFRNMPATDAPPIILMQELVERRSPVSPAMALPSKQRHDLRVLADQISDDVGVFITFDSPLRRGDWAIVGRRRGCWINGDLCGEDVLYALHRDADKWRVKAVGFAAVS